MIPTADSVWWLVAGGALSLFGFGRWQRWPVPWLVPVLFLHYAHAVSPGVAALGIFVAYAIAIGVSNWRVIPLPVWLYPAVVAVIAATQMLPYVVDRWLAPGLPLAVAVFVFPLAWVVMEFASTRASPSGAWGAVAQTQVGNRPLAQLLAVTGLPGPAFLIAWFASVARMLWERGWQAPGMSAALVLLAAVLTAVVAGGWWRTRRGAHGRRVHVAVVGWPEGIIARDDLIGIFSDADTRAQAERWQPAFDAILAHFLARSREAARAGAQVIGWPEVAVMVWRDAEAALREQLAALARETRSVVCAGVALLERGPGLGFENRALLYGPDGKPLADYTKTTAVPGFEARHGRRGGGVLPVVNTLHGRMALAICYDLDFPWLIRQVGAARADLLIAPTSDWEEIRELHLASATCRAIENGTALLRPTRWGISAMVDASGREVARLDHTEKESVILIAELPIGSVPTIYPRLRDGFAWACAAALLVLTVVALR